jgi:UDP-glucose:(heptosyl)LPS alpha-1,3-glucosyltransferase
MKLAFCLFNYFPYGGLQRDFLRIARICAERGHEVHVFTMVWEGEKEPAFHLHLLTPGGYQNHARAQAFAKEVNTITAKDHFDLVIGFNKMPGLDMYYAADVCYAARNAERSWFYRLLPRSRTWATMENAVFAKGLPVTILLISSLQQSAYQQYYHTESNRFHLLPPGIAKDRAAPPDASSIRQAVRSRYQLTEDDHLLLMVGSGFKTKGLDRTIRGFAALPTAIRKKSRLFVIGDDHAEDFQQLAQSLGVDGQLQFLGGRPDVVNFLLAADLLVHPAYHENTGTVLLEAMVAGLPVLTVDVCGYAHYVKEAAAGMVLPSPFSQTAFNEALHQMLLSPEKHQWHENGLRFGKEADIYSMPIKVADLIEQTGKARAMLSA